MNDPVLIRVELEHMRHTMQVALSDYHGEMTKLIQSAIAEVVTVEGLKATISAMVREEVSTLLRSSLQTSLRQYVIKELEEDIGAMVHEAAMEHLGGMRRERAPR